MAPHPKLDKIQLSDLRRISANLKHGQKMTELVKQFKSKFPTTNFNYRQLSDALKYNQVRFKNPWFYLFMYSYLFYLISNKEIVNVSKSTESSQKNQKLNVKILFY